LTYFVYIIACRTGHLYTGYTNDMKRRLFEHNNGLGSKFTRSRRPVILKYQEPKKNRISAMKRELEIKKMSRTKKLLLCNSF
jgi:putative endonuclease